MRDGVITEDDVTGIVRGIHIEMGGHMQLPQDRWPTVQQYLQENVSKIAADRARAAGLEERLIQQILNQPQMRAAGDTTDYNLRELAAATKAQLAQNEANRNVREATQRNAIPAQPDTGVAQRPQENAEPQRLYRGSARGPTIDLTDQDRSQVRFIDKGKTTEMVKTSKGISVNRNLAMLKTIKPPVREVRILPPTLTFQQTGKPDHFEIVPKKEMTWNEYKIEVRKIQLGPIQ